MIEEQDVANRIFVLRQAAKISQEELGAQIGVSKSAISSFEKHKSMPSVDSLIGLARFFDTTVDYLLTGKEEVIPLGNKKRIGDKNVDAEDTARHRLAVAVQVMRLDCNMSVSEAAERLGVTESFLRSVEIGEEYIDNELLAKVHAVYKPEGEIFELDDKEGNNDASGALSRYYSRLVSRLEEREQTLQKELDELRGFVNRTVSAPLITVDSNLQENIVLINKQAAASYSTRYLEPKYYLELPSFSIPLPQFRNGTFRGFEVENNSMSPTFYTGDWVIARYVDRTRESIKDGAIYVLVTREILIVTRVLNSTTHPNALIVQFDNEPDKAFEVSVERIQEMWSVVANMGFKIPNARFDIHSRLSGLEGDIHDIIARLERAGI